MSMLKKDSLIKGTLILAAAALVARFLGLFQRIPLDYMLGEEGNIAFGLANQIYLVLLLVATAGFPSAISKMVSERYTLGKVEEARRIYHAALVFGAVSGLILATALFTLAPFIANEVAKNPEAVLAIRAIAPALILFPIIAMMRGYFQGRRMMSAGGMSQIMEQFVRVLLGLALGYLVLQLGWGDDWGAAAVTFGSVFGSIAAFGVMLHFARKLKRMDAMDAGRLPMDSSSPFMPIQSRTSGSGGAKMKYSAIYREVFSMSLPAIVTSMAINVIYLFDLVFFNRLTDGYYLKDAAVVVLEDLTLKAQSLAGIPPILAIALGSSIVPIVAAAYKVKNMKEVERQASNVIRIVCFTGVPFALLLSIASYSITGLLFESPSGSDVVAALSASTIVQITMMTSNSILYGMGKQKISMTHTLIGLILKAVISIALAPLMGVYGFVVASIICFVVVTLLNLRWLNKKEAKLTVLGKRWLPYLGAVAIAALAGWGAEFGVLSLTDGLHAKVSYFLAAASAALVIGGLYVILLILLRVVRPEDVNAFPAALRKPFNMLMKLVYRQRAV
ncbi:putative polysaccharide biosynthesis protein [Paenibacillus chungangensis]|uniref:Polysaccharide biosynthesis C-terminal domain-containing protein n=1 Tax=Paenibacillus chungangensis TaxID=696535 RepID=A0ABW3HS76_9BACL